jgi:hypothetical protein
MNRYICHTQCYKFSTLWKPGDVIESEEHPRQHFSLLPEGASLPRDSKRIQLTDEPVSSTPNFRKIKARPDYLKIESTEDGESESD